jgi:Tripartite tricarboxylate transporter family receptor
MTELLARVVAEKLQQRWSKGSGVGEPARACRHLQCRQSGDRRLHPHALLERAYRLSDPDKHLAFDPMRDFVGLMQLAITPLSLVVPPDSSTKGLKRSMLGELNYSSAGLGGTTGIAGALFRANDQNPCRAPSLHGAFRNAQRDHPWRRGTRIFVLCRRRRCHSGRTLAGPSRHRSRSLARSPPTCRSFKEAGLTECEYGSWFGISAPRGYTQGSIIEKSQLRYRRRGANA